MVTVYGLRVPGGPIRYVGQTRRPLAVRLYYHRYATDRLGADYAVNRWLRKHPDVEAVTLMADATWNEDEIRLIADLKSAGAKLLNSTSGGGGAAGMDPEVVKRRALANTGKKRTAETKARMSAWQKGSRLSDERKAKLSEAHRVITDEQVTEVRRLRNDGLSYKEIALRTSIYRGTVYRIVNKLRACYA